MEPRTIVAFLVGAFSLIVLLLWGTAFRQENPLAFYLAMITLLSGTVGALLRMIPSKKKNEQSQPIN